MKSKYIMLTMAMMVIAMLSACNMEPTDTEMQQPINITVLLDLSDRLVQNLTPCQMDRDTAIVNYLVHKFINKSVSGGNLLVCKNRMHVMFWPSPDISNINYISKNMDVDLSALQGAAKKESLLRMEESYRDGLSEIYNSTLKTANWIGCDIWSFFSDYKIDDYCIKDSARNIVVILTDGYIYHKDALFHQGVNEYSYILPQTLSVPNSKLITKREGLENLEVLILEVNPKGTSHYAQIKTIIEEWLSSMGIQHCKVAQTEHINNTSTIIDKFLGF